MTAIVTDFLKFSLVFELQLTRSYLPINLDYKYRARVCGGNTERTENKNGEKRYDSKEYIFLFNRKFVM